MPSAATRRALVAALATVAATPGLVLGHASEAPAAASFAPDDECAGDDAQCALNALQFRAAKVAGAASEEGAKAAGAAVEDGAVVAAGAGAEGVAEATAEDTEGGRPIWHYAQNCWYACKGAGFCQNFCGPGNACCRYLRSGDPGECHSVRFWPVLHMHTCVRTSIKPAPPGPAHPIYTDPALSKPSTAPLMSFYLYRVQSDENYDPENQNLGNLGGMLWYLHNEIVYHPALQRRGTYFATRKTRLEKFRVNVKATQPLYDLGMNFGVVNAFDVTKCTGPFDCENFAKYGYTVGCENWEGGAASFPHGQWVGANKYPGAKWYSLPGPCPSKGLKEKDATCLRDQPGGACRNGVSPTGTADCTYNYEKVGELSINELEGITNPQQFVTMGGTEYDQATDKGVYSDFWNNKGDPEACQKRIDHAEALFKRKYPGQPELAEPPCDFDKYKFYPDKKM